MRLWIDARALRGDHAHHRRRPHFSSVGAPHASLSSGPNEAGYSQLRFADSDNGFAFGPDLYATHDGGRTWHSLSVGGQVNDLAIFGGEVYAIVDVSGSGAAGARLMHSPVSADAWTAVPAAGDVSAGLWVLGSDVFVQSGEANGIGVRRARLARQRSQLHELPVPKPWPRVPVPGEAPPVVWAHCATGTESGVWRSTDGGATSHRRAERPAQPPELGGIRRRVGVDGRGRLPAALPHRRRRRDLHAGKITQSPAADSQVAAWAWLGFTDPTHGVALGFVGSVAPANERLYYTLDGGQTYHS